MEPDKALEKLEALCAASERSSYELRMTLARWGVDGADAARIIRSLERDGFLDDGRFARAFVNDRYRFSRWGRAKLRAGLYGKRIPADIIAEALEVIDEEVYEENLRGLLRGRIRSMGDEARTYGGRTRLFRFAAGRGYEPSLVADIIRDPGLWRGC